MEEEEEEDVEEENWLLTLEYRTEKLHFFFRSGSVAGEGIHEETPLVSVRFAIIHLLVCPPISWLHFWRFTIT